MQRKKQLIAPFNPDGDKYLHVGKENLDCFLFKGITSSVSTIDSKCMALRELILCISSDDEHLLNLTEADKTNGYISYEKFCAIDVQLLTDEEKLFLANQALSTLSYPSDTNARFTHARQDKARKYQGMYEVYTPMQNGSRLLKMILLIDSLSQVTLKIKYDNREDSETYTYHGVCEFYNHNLHIGAHLDAAHPTEQKHSEFIFDYIKDTNRQPLKYFKGTHLTTDDDGNAFASKFIACKIDKEEIAKPGTSTATSLVEKEKLFRKLLRIYSIEQYFRIIVS